MDRNTEQQIIKIICFCVGCVIAFYVLMWVVPYLVIFLALCGAWYLWQEYQRDKRQ